MSNIIAEFFSSTVLKTSFGDVVWSFLKGDGQR